MVKKAKLPPICTYCGKFARPMTRDDPFPKALWAGKSADRVIRVPSCGPCNRRSNESILKHFFVVLDSRFYPEIIRHFKDPDGRKDFQDFSSAWKEKNGKWYLYADAEVTAKFVKMFMGIRRHLLREKWYYVPAEGFTILKIDPVDDLHEGRVLPLRVGGRNPSRTFEPDINAALKEPMRHKFRDFRYDWFADDDDGMVFGLKYEREEFAHLGNRLFLICAVPKSVQGKVAASET
ncbi:MAG: hypothetical protein K8T89_01630 [Planctomycetes bacterium]|nr:hypothetical protein [Planctomycetota bacterium]